MLRIIMGMVMSINANVGVANEPSRVANPIVKGVHYIGATVSNLNNSRDIYQASADLQPVTSAKVENDPWLDRLAGRSGVKVSTQLMKSVNAQLNLMQFARPSAEAKQYSAVAVAGPGIAHVCYHIAKSTGAYEKFLQLGATVMGARDMVKFNEEGPMSYAYVKDKDGLILEIEQVDVEALNPEKSLKHDYRIRHIALSTPNIDKAVAFYSTLLETTNPSRAGDLTPHSGEKFDQVTGLTGTAIEMVWFQIRNLELEIVQYHSYKTELPSKPRPIDAIGYNAIVFDVTDLTAAKKKLLEAGGTLVKTPKNVMDKSIFYGRDLDGNLLGFQILANDSPYSSQNFEDNGI